MKGSVVIVLAVLCAVCLAGRWAKPTVIIKSNLQLQFLAQATDPHRNRTFFLYTREEGNDRFQLYVQTIDNDVVTPAVPLMKGRFHGLASDIVISGKSVFLALNVRRAAGLKDYLDVYFVESSDEGATWSEPVPMPRENLQDPVNRFPPSIMTNEANTRVCVAYFRAPFADELGDIAMSCRPPDSKIFSPEITVAKNQLLLSRVRVGATAHNRRVTMHMVYIAKVEGLTKLYYAASEDNGLHWSAKSLGDLPNIDEYREPSIATAKSDFKDENMLLVYAFAGNGDAAVFMSTDKGTTWQRSTMSGSEKYTVSNVVLCKYKLGVWASFYSRSTEIVDRRVDNEGRFNFWRVDTSSVRELDNPFTFEYRVLTVYRPQLGCSYFADTYGIISAAAIAIHQDGSFAILYNRATGQPN